MKARNGAVDSRSPPPSTAAINAPARHHPQSCWERAKRLYLQTVKTVIFVDIFFMIRKRKNLPITVAYSGAFFMYSHVFYHL
jgi:hypothetical protein